MKTHIVIPARYHSTRLPAKPLLNIHGKPLILWTAQKALQARFADSVCVATDDERIFVVCQQAGVPVVMTDPHPTGTDRLAQVASLLGFHDDDIVINMQGDEPLLPAVLMAQVADLLCKNHDCAMATLCEPIVSLEDFFNPSVVKVVKADNKALYFSRSPIPYDRDQHNQSYEGAYRHLGLYAYKAQTLQQFVQFKQGVLEQQESLEQLRILEHGQSIAIDIAKVHLPIGVDTQADLDRLNQMPLSDFLGFWAGA